MGGIRESPGLSLRELAAQHRVAEPTASRIVRQPLSVSTRWFSVSVNCFPSASVSE